MKLERIDIRHLAGLDDPVSIRFEPDAVNFITKVAKAFGSGEHVREDVIDVLRMEYHRRRHEKRHQQRY